MPQLDFFAAHNDQIALLEFLFSQTDVRIFELASEYGQNLREFKSVAEMSTLYSLGRETSDQKNLSTLFALSSSAVSGDPVIERVSLNPRKCNGHTFRYRLGGGALMQLYFGGVYNKDERTITKSHFGHNSQIRAENWSVAQNINWESLAKLSNKIQYHIRKRLAVAKVPGRPVLPEALNLVNQGYSLKEFVNSTWQCENPT